MDYSNRWKELQHLGEGGQGKVFKVLDKKKINVDSQFLISLAHSLRKIISDKNYSNEEYIEYFDYFQKGIVEILRTEDLANQGALKILHKPQDARDAERAEERIKREIEAMKTTTHPNLLKILDVDTEYKWFVSQYHPRGTLFQHIARYKGDFASALRAFRPLVAGVAELHKEGIVHRDIKPQNVFIDTEGDLVLGDFGLVYFSDDRHSRLSGTIENVGTRDWMPPWAMGRRIEKVPKSFDVFSLGKLLWSMVSASPFLLLWYFERDEYNLEKMFPNVRYIHLANPLLKKCIVENKNECLPNAVVLLAEVDKVLAIMDANADRIDPLVKRRCKVCGIGEYNLLVDRNMSSIKNFGITPAGTRSFKIFTCTYCGHVQMFAFGNGSNPPAWPENDDIRRSMAARAFSEGGTFR